MKKWIFSMLFLAACSGKEDAPVKPDQHYAIIESPSGLKYHTGLLHFAGEKQQVKKLLKLDLAACENLPTEFDLRKLGLVSSVKDQGQCGSCGMFAKTSSLESAMLGQGVSLDLSEQEMVACDKKNWGCEGSTTEFSYQINHGQGLESAFPYTSGRTGSNGSCKSVPVAAKGISAQFVNGTDKEIKCALYTYKTSMAITVDANNFGSPPSSEKVPFTKCAAGQTNHMINVVGWWTDSKGKTQYLAKNSWGTSWGDKGYMSLPLGCASFGDEVAFIQVEKKPDPTPTPVPPSPTPSPTPPAPTPSPVPVDECKEAYVKVGECLKLKNIFGLDDSCWKAYAKLVQCLEKAGN